jgi:hypothetical protein
MVTVPLPDAQLMTFDEFINWKPDNCRFELHHGTPIERLPSWANRQLIGLFYA